MARNTDSPLNWGYIKSRLLAGLEISVTALYLSEFLVNWAHIYIMLFLQNTYHIWWIWNTLANSSLTICFKALDVTGSLFTTLLPETPECVRHFPRLCVDKVLRMLLVQREATADEQGADGYICLTGSINRHWDRKIPQHGQLSGRFTWHFSRCKYGHCFLLFIFFGWHPKLGIRVNQIARLLSRYPFRYSVVQETHETGESRHHF